MMTPHGLGKTIRCPSCSEAFVAARDSRTEAKARRRRPSSSQPNREGTANVFHRHRPPVEPFGADDAEPGEPAGTATEPAPAEQKPRKKKKRKKSPELPRPSGLKMAFFGFVGGSVGGLAWIALVYFLRVRLGIIAILVGVLTGIGVQTGNSGQDAHGPGEIAVFTAFAVILVCKYVIVCLLLEKIVWGEAALKAFTLYDFLWCSVAGRWAYRTASGGLF